jgi:putative transposase
MVLEVLAGGRTPAEAAQALELLVLRYYQLETRALHGHPFRLYGYCLMTNHFHLLLSPDPGHSISRILQSLSVAHTWHYHQRQATVGHVWQGRFKSPVIEEDDHALVVLRYIEANPLRAGMVSNLASYPWSSYRVHGMGGSDPLLTPLPIWESLGKQEARRQAYWREWLHTPFREAELGAVRRSVVTGRPFGSTAWTRRVAGLLGLGLEERRRGRPKKEAKMN